jgi:hypothetical protein
MYEFADDDRRGATKFDCFHRAVIQLLLQDAISAWGD